MNIGPLRVGPGEPCALIAELGNAHNGSLDRAIRLLDAAKACGASAAKLQAYTVDELIALRGDGPAPAQWGEQGWTMRSLYEKAQTPLAWLPTLFVHAHTIGLPLFSSVFGPDSLAALEACGNPCYKIAALDCGDRGLLDLAVATGKPVVVSVRGLNQAHTIALPHKLDWADHYNDNIHFLHCPPQYPTPPDLVELSRMEGHVSGTRILGLSSHCLDPRLPIAAVACGAKMLEYHFMLDDEPSELEANISLGEGAFAAMVADVRATEVLLGDL
jgi:sialic acid synthase SpsE